MGSAFLYVVPAWFFWRAGRFRKAELAQRAAAEAALEETGQAQFNLRLALEDGD